MDSIPRLNLLARPALLGLSYRALAQDASGDAAPLTLRRIETVQAQLTLLQQRQSELKATQGIAADHAATARKAASQAQLDVRIFHESYEPPKRGLLRRLTPHEREQERRLAELESIAQHESGRAAELAERQQLATSDLLLVESELKDARAERERLQSGFEEELAAHVLGLVAGGNLDEARDTLETARRDVRGSFAVGALLVLTELFAGESGAGLRTAEARGMLDSLEPLFSQQADATPRTLALLLRLAEGHPLTQAELGLLAPGNFRSPGCYRLYELVVVLAGGSVDPDESGPWAGTLRLAGAALQSARRTGVADVLSAFESGDTLRMLLAAGVLLAHNELEQLWVTDWARSLPERGLLEHLSTPIPAWPPALATQIAAALAALTLLAQYISEGGASGRYGRWLEESYGWPKDDLYWWMLATLKDDPALLKNQKGSPDQLFTISDSSYQTN